MPIGFIKQSERDNKDLATYNTIKLIYEKGFTINQACSQVGITRRSYYHLLKRVDKPSVAKDTNQEGGGVITPSPNPKKRISSVLNNINSSLDEYEKGLEKFK